MNKYIAEFLGTALFLYVILAVGSPIAIGLALTLVIIMVGHVSGGHFNPAVSLMMYTNKAINLQQLVLYIIMQCLGGVSVLFFRNLASKSK